MSEVDDTTQAELAYRDWEPGEKASSPRSTRNTFKVRNPTGEAGKYSLKIGAHSTQHFRIGAHKTESHDCTGQTVVGTNDGKTALEWQRT
ncbi:hypothetical protein [Lysobacter fragariae]